VTTLLCCALTATLGQGGLYLSLALFILANIAYQAGLQFYDALLPEVSTEENRGWIGGMGIGVGYLGSYIGIGSGLLLLSRIGYQGIFQLTAALFLIFAIPCFLFVRERGNPRSKGFGVDTVRQAVTQTRNTIRNASRYPGVLRFLIGRVFYTDAVNTVIAIMGLYVINLSVSSGLSQQQGERTAQFILLGAITFAIIGGFVWGAVVDRIGPKRSLNFVLSLWIVVFTAAALMGLLGLPLWVFYIIASLAGIALGGTWAADRPYMQRISPPARLGEFYGLYGMVGRFSAITGPLLWAGVLAATRGWLEPEVGQAIGVLLLMVLVIVSFVILRTVSDERRVWSAEDSLDAEAAR
jgi:UMF1 family MFS transporter